MPIKLSTFILTDMQRILACWDDYARTMTPAADQMSLQALRDHGEAMLREIARDIDSPQTDAQQIEKSQGESPDDSSSSAASKHGRLRHLANFTLIQLSSEFRALRASVLRLWFQQVEVVSPAVLEDVVRFNEAIDQALAESIVTYSDRASHARDLFDAILGHDLRSPLSAMALAGEVLALGNTPPGKAAELGGRIASSARYMSNLVVDMLEFARIRLGNMPLPIQRVTASIESVCSEAIADAAAMHPGCDFQLAAEGRDEAWIDPDRTRQLLVNLLGNAGQHGDRGRPVQLVAKSGDDGIVFRVTNEGPEIPPDLLEAIFEPLVRLDAGMEHGARRTTSLGLGLHIAREIAASHGGSIAVRSEGRRTTFTVSLPAA